MLEWLKTILGDHYTEDIDKQISAEIGLWPVLISTAKTMS